MTTVDEVLSSDARITFVFTVTKLGGCSLL